MKQVGVVSLGGQDYKILLCKPEEAGSPVTDDVAGVCSQKDQTLYINSDHAKASLRGTLVHEAMHAVINESGAINYLAERLKISPTGEEMNSIEETLVRILSPHIATAIPGIVKAKL